MSIAMVPCQRRDSWADAVRKSCSLLYRLCSEVFDPIIRIMLQVAYHISIDEGEHTAAMEGYD